MTSLPRQDAFVGLCVGPGRVFSSEPMASDFNVVTLFVDKTLLSSKEHLHE